MKGKRKLQCSLDRLGIHREPEQDKTLNEDEWKNELLLYLDNFKVAHALRLMLDNVFASIVLCK